MISEHGQLFSKAHTKITVTRVGASPKETKRIERSEQGCSVRVIRQGMVNFLINFTEALWNWVKAQSYRQLYLYTFGAYVQSTET